MAKERKVIFIVESHGVWQERLMPFEGERVMRVDVDGIPYYQESDMRTVRVIERGWDKLLQKFYTRYSCGHVSFQDPYGIRYCAVCGAKVVEQ